MIEVKDISFSYGARKVLRNVSFSMQQGECVAVLGNNGAGKSTLVTCINRILRPTGGCVEIDGRDLLRMSRNELARHVSYVAQKNELSHCTVFDAVLLGRKPYIRWSATEEDFDVVHNALKAIGLEAFQLRYLNELSGGELQKVMIARAIAQEPKLMLLDEPTSNLDPHNQYESMSLVRHCAYDHGITALVVLHDLNLALRYCDRFLFLKDGAVFRYGGPEIVTDGLLEEVYQMPMRVCSVADQRVVIPGAC